MIFKFLALLALVVLTFSAGSSFARSEIVMRLEQLRVVELVRAMGFSQDPPFYVINEAIFVSHHSEIRGGARDFRTYWGRVAADTAQVIRIFQDGDYVFAQSRYELDGLKAGFDVFRYEKGEIVEHWGGAVPFADDLVGGPGVPDATADTGTNKAFVGAYLAAATEAGADDVADRFLWPDAVLHGVEPLDYRGMELTLGEGDFVLVLSLAEKAGDSVRVFDLFRLVNGMISEQWQMVSRV
jgi:predicted SnoaL-like aldol condensation-catalyzing enzyme